MEEKMEGTWTRQKAWCIYNVKRAYIFFSATSSLAYTSPSSTSTTQNARSSSQQLGANSLVHCLLKLAGRDNIKEPLLKALYGLLATLALSSECRNIMFKVSWCLFCWTFLSIETHLNVFHLNMNFRYGTKQIGFSSTASLRLTY